MNGGGEKIIFSHGTSSARGVALLTSKTIFAKLKNIETDNEGHLICIDIMGDTKFSLCAIYAPNEDKPDFFLKVSTMLQCRSENKIILGDFNLVLDVQMDRENTYHNNNRAKARIEDMCENFHGLKEISTLLRLVELTLH